MANIIHRPLGIMSFNANDILKQRHELSKLLEDLRIDLALFSGTHLKHHERFSLPNYHVYRMAAMRAGRGELSSQLGKASPTIM
jgi:hypothetical protein